MYGRTALYHVYDDNDGLLYIGVSKHFGTRWQQHARSQPWWPEARRMTIYWYDTRDDALDAEALAIFTEQPEHNVLHRKQAQRLRRQLQRTPKSRSASRSKLAPQPEWDTKAPVATIEKWGPGVTQEDIDYMDMIDRICPDPQVPVKHWLPPGHVFTDYET